MKLYYATGTCSLSAHIALREAGLDFSLVSVSTRTHKLADGSDFYTINPLGYVPVLELDDGTRLTEGPAIVQYVADQVPERQLAPAPGSLARCQMQGWLNFIATELHKGFAPLFDPKAPADFKPVAAERLLGRMAWTDRQLEGRAYLLGEAFSVADAYLFTVTGWAGYVKVDLSPFAHIAAFRQRMAARPAVQAALRAEGMLK